MIKNRYVNRGIDFIMATALPTIAGPSENTIKYPLQLSEEGSCDDPSITNVKNCLYDICMTVSGNCASENEAIIEGGRYAVYRFEGSMMEFSQHIMDCSGYGFRKADTVWLTVTGWTSTGTSTAKKGRCLWISAFR